LNFHIATSFSLERIAAFRTEAPSSGRRRDADRAPIMMNEVRSMPPSTTLRTLTLLTALLLLPSCQSAYYSALESFGLEKRELLVQRVEAAQESQEEAKEEFRSALEEFQSVVEVDGGELEERYNTLAAAFDDARDQAEDVRDRIDSVESVGEALFKEWKRELDTYQNQDLRRQSSAQLETTRTRFDALMVAMNRAAERMDPVLAVFQDQVLFLKHNLNARAIASLEVEQGRIEERVEILIEEMEAAIQEAERFLKSMSDEGTV
jgi:Skp family chaperone for outer membrane proteins